MTQPYDPFYGMYPTPGGGGGGCLFNLGLGLAKVAAVVVAVFVLLFFGLPGVWAFVDNRFFTGPRLDGVANEFARSLETGDWSTVERLMCETTKDYFRWGVPAALRGVPERAPFRVNVSPYVGVLGNAWPVRFTVTASDQTTYKLEIVDENGYKVCATYHQWCVLQHKTAALDEGELIQTCPLSELDRSLPNTPISTTTTQGG